jgi:hypothetical protein
MATTLLSVPDCLVGHYSKRLDISEFLPDAALEGFKKRFDTRIAQYGDSHGTYLVVPSEDFEDSMITFLDEHGRKKGDREDKGGR